MMDWKDVPKYGKDGKFITRDEFREVAADIAAKIAHDVNDVTFGFLLSLYAARVSNELFKEDK